MTKSVSPSEQEKVRILVKSMTSLVSDEEWWDNFKLHLAKVVTPVIAKSTSAAAKESYITLSNLGVTVDWDLINIYAKQFATTYAFDLITSITESIKLSVRTTLATAIEKGLTLQETIFELAWDLGPSRAKAIATTEMTRLFAKANSKLWKKSGVPSKKWMTANDELVCDICGPLNGKIVEISKGTFPGIFSGIPTTVLEPPAHVMCRCYLAPSFEPQEVKEDDIDPELLDILNKWEDGKYGSMPYGEWSKLDVNVANWMVGITEEELQEVRSYTSSGAYIQNNLLRVNGGDRDLMSAEILAKIDRVSSALEKNNPLGQDIVIFRGVSGEGGTLLSELAHSYKLGDSYLDHAFLSTTILETKADSFANGAILKILNPGGAIGQYIAPYSHYKNEFEWLLPSATELTVLKVEWRSDGTPIIWCVIKETMKNLKFMIFEGMEVKRMDESKAKTEEIDRPSSIWEELNSLKGMEFTIDGVTFSGSDYEEMSKLMGKYSENGH